MTSFVRIQVSVIGLFVCFFLFQPAFTHGYEPPNVPVGEKLELIETDHFRIIYQESLTESAPVIASWFEEAYADLTPIFSWIPKGKTDVLYVDSYDIHNGWATPIPHNLISIYAGGSGQGTSIYQPGNYLKRTIYHELAHILTMDERQGYNKTLSGIFGKVNTLGDPLSALMLLLTSSPASLSPDWFLEGEGVWAETEFTPPGRGQSTYSEMIFRCAVRDNNLLPVSKWYLEIPHWPYGLGAYLYGGKLIQYIYETKDSKNSVGDLQQEVAGSFMFNSNRATRKSTGKNFKNLAHDMLEHEKKKQNKHLSVLAGLTETTVPRLTPEKISVTQPVFLNGSVYYLGYEEERGSAVYHYDVSSGHSTRITKTWEQSAYGMLAASGDRKSLVYTNLQIQDSENVWFEVHLLDPVTRKDQVLTEYGRYKWVTLSADNSRLAAASQRSGQNLLIECDMDQIGRLSGETILDTMPFETDLTSPSYSPDGNSISYVTAGLDGFRLMIYDRQARSKKAVLKTTSQIIAPHWHPSGKELIYASDENGVYNLYVLALNNPSSPQPLTHVTGGVFFPSVSADGQTLTVTSYDGYGPHLSILPLDRHTYKDRELPVVSATWDRKFKKETIPQTDVELTQESGSYNSLSKIRFDYWTPWLSASTHGVQGGLAVSFSDPSGYQDIKGLIGRESEYGSNLGAAHYKYKGLRPQFHLYANKDQEIYPGLLASNVSLARYDHAEDVTRLGASVEYPVLRRDRNLHVGGGYQYMTRDFISQVEEKWQQAPDLDTLPTDEDEGAIWAGIRYDDTDVYRSSSSLEKGRAISASFELTRPEFGGSLDKTRYFMDWKEYITMSYLNNHVLKLSAAFGTGSGDDYAQGLFGIGGGAVFSPASLVPGIPSSLDIRGYDQNFLTGDQALTAGMSYRFPFLDFSKGYESGFPIYTRQLFAELFLEGGQVWDDKGYTGDLDWIWSTGVEVNFAMKMFRYLSVSPGLGIAYAPDRNYRDSDLNDFYIYLSIKGWVNY